MTEYETKIIKCIKYNTEVSSKEKFNLNEKIQKNSDYKIKNKDKSSLNKKESVNFVMMNGKNELPNIFFDDLLHLEYLFTIDPDKEKYFKISKMLIKAVEHYNNIENNEKFSLFNKKLKDHLIYTKIPTKEKSIISYSHKVKSNRFGRSSTILDAKNFNNSISIENVNHSDYEDLVLVNGIHNNIINSLPEKIIKRNFEKFKTKYLEDKESKYKLFCRNFNLKKFIANGKLEKEAIQFKNEKDHKITNIDKEIKTKILKNEESKALDNSFDNEFYIDISENILKETDNFFINSQNLANRDLQIQGNNFKIRLKKKLEDQRKNQQIEGLMSSIGKRYSGKDESLQRNKSCRKLSFFQGSPERVHHSTQKAGSAKIKSKHRRTLVQRHNFNLANKNFCKKPTISTNIEEYLNKFHSIFKETFILEIKNVIEVEKSNYEKKKELGTRNVEENIETDLIFNNKEDTQSENNLKFKNENDENYKIYLSFKKSIKENFEKELENCVKDSKKDIDFILLRNKNSNFNKNEKLVQLRDNLLEELKKLV